MRSFRRILAASVAVATIAGAGLAAPAYADPSNGEGCAGLPTVPNAYVCLISLTPTEALPDISTSSIPVTVPPVCYVAGCTSPTTVNVPIPGAQPGDGDIAVIWHGGTYYPIGLGIGGSVFPIVQGAIDLASGALSDVVADVNAILDDAPPPAQLLAAINNQTAEIESLVEAEIAAIQYQYGEEIAEIESLVAGFVGLVQHVLEDYPEILRGVLENIAERLDDIQIGCGGAICP